MDNCFTGRRDRSRQTPEKDVLYIIPAGPVSSVHSLGSVQTRFEFISKFEENAVYSTKLKLIFI